jgi:hypothetical protein
MSKYRVEVYREWTERGYLTVDADNEDEARDLAQEELSEDADSIQWHTDNMEPGNQGVESAEVEQ